MMRRTTLVVDDTKIARVREILGTKGIRDTVDRALDAVIASQERQRAVDQLRTMAGLDEIVLRNARKEAWRDRRAVAADLKRSARRMTT